MEHPINDQPNKNESTEEEEQLQESLMDFMNKPIFSSDLLEDTQQQPDSTSKLEFNQNDNQQKDEEYHDASSLTNGAASTSRI